jgi:hypothetical protein
MLTFITEMFIFQRELFPMKTDSEELPRRKRRPKAAQGRKELKSWTPQAFNFK